MFSKFELPDLNKVEKKKKTILLDFQKWNGNKDFMKNHTATMTSSRG